ncbi:MAG: phosphate acetyltransferase, partial [Alcaligenaceae bacterium]|nr:phosphate acetyltransferase [Alcaligenaceae bacterium]
MSKSVRYDTFIQQAQESGRRICAVAHPCDETSLGAAIEAGELGLFVPLLVGPAQRIHDLARQHGFKLDGLEIIDTPHSHASAELAVEAVQSGRATLLMKGSLHTDELLHAVLAHKGGLRTGRRLSHVFIMDVPNHDDLLFITDAAINILPDLETKAD